MELSTYVFKSGCSVVGVSLATLREEMEERKREREREDLARFPRFRRSLAARCLFFRRG